MVSTVWSVLVCCSSTHGAPRAKPFVKVGGHVRTMESASLGASAGVPGIYSEKNGDCIWETKSCNKVALLTGKWFVVPFIMRSKHFNHNHNHKRCLLTLKK